MQVSGHGWARRQASLQPTLLAHGNDAVLTGHEMSIPRPGAFDRKTTHGILGQFGPATADPDHSAPVAGRIERRRFGRVVTCVSGFGARCASASRNCVRPRWMRERTVPSLIPSVAAISS